MKYRKDFVTNSSSSSFVCEICGATESGYDLTYEDAMMFKCENGHVFCEDHIEKLSREDMEDYLFQIYSGEFPGWEEYSPEKLKEFSDEEIKDEYYYHIDRRCIPEIMCPICSFKRAKPKDIADYFMKTNNIKENDLLRIWITQFGSYENLQDFLEN